MAGPVIITDMARTGSDDLHWKASGTCGKRDFTAQTILYKGAPIFKIQGAGSVADGRWSRGERARVARVCRAAMIVELGGLEPLLPSRLPKKRGKPRRRRDPNVKYHHSGLPMNSSISALKRSR
ncbi:hypothetical protein CMI47_08030 [Candidatus Pacearchaeota archaeon]|jgi:hypothetical protein|nr:hypothetical protein [Candidatus Pacearchaeota archaeon]